MFFQGMMVGSGTISLANFQADIIGLLTGTITSPSQLSSNFLPGAVFNNTVAAGWELHDNAAGAAANGVTPKVIRAPYSDDPTKFKNVFINSSAAGKLGFNGYETWDSATHIGTNPMQAVLAAVSFQSLFSGIASAPATTPSMFTISSSINHIYISLSSALISSATACVYFSEYTRDDPWNTVANGYPSWLQSGFYPNLEYVNYAWNTVFNGFTAIPRVFDPSINTDKTSVLISGVTTPSIILCPNGQLTQATAFISNGGGSFGSSISCPILGANYLGGDPIKASTKYLFDIALRMSSPSPTIGGAFLGGNCSAIAPHVFYTANNAVLGDTIVMNNKKYQISGVSSARLAILME